MADIFRAAETGNVKALKRWLKSGESCNSQTKSTKSTPLIWGARKRHLKVVKLLLKKVSIDVDMQDASGCAALHYACQQQDSKIVSLLMQKDANLSLVNRRGQTPFQMAPFGFFNRHVLEFINEKIQVNKAQISLNTSREAIACMLADTALQQTWTVESSIRDAESRIDELSNEIEKCNTQVRPCREAEEAARSVHGVLKQNLEKLRAERILIEGKAQRLRSINSNWAKQTEILIAKKLELDETCLQLEREVEELYEGLRKKTGVMVPMKRFPDDVSLQKVCLQGLVSLCEADLGEEVHQALWSENGISTVQDVMNRFKLNHKIQREGFRLQKAIRDFAEKMGFDENGRPTLRQES